MNKEYLISVKENTNKIIDKRVNNFYIFDKNKIQYVRDILFLEYKYIKMKNNM